MATDPNSNPQQTVSIDPDHAADLPVVHLTEDDLEPTYDPAKDKRPAFQKVNPRPTGPTIEAAPEPSLAERAKRVVTEGIPQFSSRTVDNPKYGQEQFLAPEEMLTPQQQREHPVFTGSLEAAGEMTSPANIATAAATAGVGELDTAAAKVVTRALSGVFSAQMLASAYQQYPELKKAMDSGDTAEAERIATKMGIETAGGAAGAAHTFEGATKAVPAGIAHLKEAAQNFVENSAIVNARAPEGSLEAGFAKIGAQPRRPAASFEPVEPTHRITPKGGEVRIDIGGKNKGMVKYTMGAGEDGASITATNIDPELRGQGHGKAMYTRAAREAEARGAKFITSDLTGTDSYDSGRVWESLMRDHPEAIEKIPSKAGSPGYRWNFADEIPEDIGKTSEGPQVDLSSLGTYAGGAVASAKPSSISEKMASPKGFGTTENPLKAGFILSDGRMVPLMPGAEHNDMIAMAGGEPLARGQADIARAESKGLTREQVIENEGTIRTRYRQTRGGNEVVFSVPSSGVSPSQIEQMKKSVAAMGRNGRAVVEVGDPILAAVQNTQKDFVRPSDIEPMLREIQAHPEQHTVSPNEDLQKSAQKYAKARGLPEVEHKPVPVDTERAKQIAKDYDAAEHNPNDPQVKASYDALKSETKDQFHHLRDDLGIKFEPQSADPYRSAPEMMNDIKNNKRLKVFTGSSTGPDHPLSEIDPETGQSYNTLFRWVHDAFGHAAGGNDFTEPGEKSATEAHAQMYSDLARPAMRAETEGQTSWFFHNPAIEAGKAKPGAFAPQKATIIPDISNDWHETAGAAAAKNDAGGINPRTGRSDSKGVGVEVMPELRQPFDHTPTAEDFKNFYAQHKPIFDQHPELRVGWDNNSAVEGGHEINVGAVGPNAAKVAKKLDQKAAFDIGKGDIVPTGGTGLRTSFPNYPLEDRMKDLRGEPQSDIKGFEHVTKGLYDNLAPDERDYIKDNPGLQKTVMSHYHRIAPSVEETSNAMQAGAALGGWWQRYMDVFHGILDDGDKEKVAQQIGPSHAEVLKQWHAALSGNKAVEDANNLAWHSYADWLDAGKPTDRKSLNDIVVKNGAQFTGEKRGNAALSDTLDRKGKVLKEGLDTTKLYNLVNSPEMKGERLFRGDVFRDDEAKNPLMGKDSRNRKIASMGATVAGKGNLNRLVIDTHIMDFYGQKPGSATAARYLADSAHLRQAAQDLGLKPGEGQEQLWGTVLGLKTLLKEGLTPEEAGGKLDANTIRQIGKDYAEVIANDPEITKPGGLLDRLQEEHGIGTGSTGFGPAYSKASGSGASGGRKVGSEARVNPSLLEKTAERIRGTIDPSKIKTPGQGLELGESAEPEGGDTSFRFGANEKTAHPGDTSFVFGANAKSFWSEPRPDEIYRQDGWISPEGQSLVKKDAGVSHEDMAKEMGYANSRAAQKAGNISVVGGSRNIFLSVYDLSPENKAQLRNIIAEAPIGNISIGVGPKVLENFKTKDEALDYLDRTTHFRQNTTADMSDPDARFGAARHEASHVVVSEMLRPGSITGVGLDEHGGYTNAMPPAGKTSAAQLNDEDLRNLLAVSYAGGMGEPGGTTHQHVSTDMAHRAEMVGQDAQKFAKAPELDAEAVARVNALMADPKVRTNIDRLAGEINKRGHLSGDEVRAVLATK